MLRGLPRWLGYLADAAHGQTRLGESTRRSSDLTTPMLCNLTASDLYRQVRSTLTRWVQDICESRGVEIPSLDDDGMPRWLCRHVPAIACGEDAGLCFTEIRRCVDEIERVINRPVKPRDLGPCPTLVAHHQACAHRLSAPRKAIEVTCPKCKAVHQVKDLIELLCNELEYWPLSSVEILGSRTSELPGALDYYGATLARSTFHYWRKHGMLTVRGYRNRLTLAVMPERENSTDEPVFYLADVLGLMGHDRGERAG